MQKARKNPDQNTCPVFNLKCADALLFELVSKENAQDAQVLGMVRELLSSATQALEANRSPVADKPSIT